MRSKVEARRLLDAAGLKDAKILATAYDQPALGGVFKLVAMKEGEGDWKYRIKLSERLIKTTTPGIPPILRGVRHLPRA